MSSGIRERVRRREPRGAAGTGKRFTGESRPRPPVTESLSWRNRSRAVGSEENIDMEKVNDVLEQTQKNANL